MARWHLELHLYTTYWGKRRIPLVFRPIKGEQAAVESLRDLRAQQSEILQAYLELRLVANPAPLESAHAVLDRLTALFDLGMGAAEDKVNAAVRLVVEAQREFTDVCRDDLWYLPARWQIYRLAWWSARRWRRRRTT